MSRVGGEQAERLLFRTKVAFGAGGAAETIALYSVSAFALMFYNQVLGVPAHLAGLAISVSLVIDGVMEVLAGSLSDRTRSRLGRRHPYMFAAPAPIALFLFAIFNPPAGLGQTGLLVWFSAFVILLRQAMAFFHTPHLALGGELSQDYTERSQVMAYNAFATSIGAAATTMLALTWFFPATPEYPRGLLNPEPWPRYAAAIAIATVAILFASAWFTKDRIPYLPKPAADAARFSLPELWRDLGRAVSNINYVWILAAYLFLGMTVGLREGLKLYVATFYWELASEQVRWFLLASLAGSMVAFVVAARLHGRFDKKRTILCATLTYAVAPSAPVLLGLSGILEPGAPVLLPVLAVCGMIGSGAFAVLTISVMSALADVADENELRYGVRQEGVLYATRALAAKLDSAIGSALAGFVLTMIAFPVKATPGAVSHDVLVDLAIWDGVVAAIPGLVAAVFYARYRITKASYTATRAALLARRTSPPAQAARDTEAPRFSSGVAVEEA
jgi:GPH family glycoside/pentoside/hexuronide:cation symporter